MRCFAPFVLLIAAVLLVARPASGWVDPESTVRMADEILRDSMTIPVRRIPESLLAQAHGVAIIPDVIKIGFVAAVRRGHGVVMVRDANGAWTLPQFITLTGGSVGWQAGVQDTDLVLVFMTQKSVDGLLAGKFTIGADASAAAGPVGRNAAAATDARLKAEILSYSRSRGLFVGVSLDGSVIDTNPTAFSQYYGVPFGQQVAQIPESATRLVQDLVQATEPPQAVPAEAQAAPGEPTPAGPTPAAPVPPTTVREQLAASAKQLFAIVDEPWRKYLALPDDVFTGGKQPSLAALRRALGEYDRVVQEPKYDKLVASREFQTTYGLLREYVEELSRSATSANLALPPPPAVR
jgi:lipid-binding SYLF domain-containing protein